MSKTQTSTMAQANGTHKLKGKRADGAVKSGPKDEKTDYTKWRLQDDRGCQVWQYLESDEEAQKWPQSRAEKYFLGLDTVGLPTPTLHRQLLLQPLGLERLEQER